MAKARRQVYKAKNNYGNKTNSNAGCLAQFFVSLIIIIVISVLISNTGTYLSRELKNSNYEKKQRYDDVRYDDNAGGANYYDMQEMQRSTREFWEDNPEAYEKHLIESTKAKKYREENYKK